MDHSRRIASTGWSSGQGRRQTFRFKYMLTCFAMLQADGHDTHSIQDYLGHKNIQHTVRYTELSPIKFKDFWRD